MVSAVVISGYVQGGEPRRFSAEMAFMALPRRGELIALKYDGSNEVLVGVENIIHRSPGKMPELHCQYVGPHYRSLFAKTSPYKWNKVKT